MSLFAELERRNVIRIGVAWLALSWLLVAISNLLFPAMNMPIVKRQRKGVRDPFRRAVHESVRPHPCRKGSLTPFL